MSEEIKEAVAVEATPEQVTPEVAAATVESEQPEAAPVAAVEGVPAALSTPVAPVNEGQRFLETFGDKGGVWFAQGKSFDEAMSLFVKDLSDENARLKTEVEKLSATQPTARGASPCAFSQPAAIGRPEVAKFGSKTAAAIATAVRIRK